METKVEKKATLGRKPWEGSKQGSAFPGTLKVQASKMSTKHFKYRKI